MSEDERELMMRAAGGDAAALERLLQTHRPRLLGYIAKQVPQSMRRLVEPQDVLQDTYFEAFRRMAGLAVGGVSAYPWLATIARNRIIDLVRAHRSLKRDGKAAADAGDQPVVALLQDLAIYRRTPSQSAVARELLATLEQALAKLLPDQRHALSLRYLSGLPPAEIAQRMHRTAEAVHLLCNRGLKALRKELRSSSLYI